MRTERKFIATLLLTLCIGTNHATEVSDSIYENRTVSGRVTINVDGSIIARSDTIVSNGCLTLVGQQGVTLQQNIDVQLGGMLIIHAGTPPRIRYSYDASGNRIRREKETQ